jgi:tRNA(adenine34) deaminase
MGALLSARIRKIYYGAKDKRFGTSKLAQDNNFNHKCEVEGGILKDKCEEKLSQFFKNLRG